MDAKSGRRPDEVLDELMFQSIGDLAEHVSAPGRVGGGQPFGIACRHSRGSLWPEVSTFVRPETTVFRSSLVVSRPRLNRIAPIPTSGATPMVCRTGESSIRPE